VLFAGSLIGLAIAVARRPRPPLVLPFSFASYFIVLVVCAVAAIAMKSLSETAAAGCLGVCAYYCACVALAERQVRYVPWGAGLGWRTAVKREHPLPYWSFVSLFFAVAAVLLAIVFASAAGSGT
jgi:hypothetical protein